MRDKPDATPSEHVNATEIYLTSPDVNPDESIPCTDDHRDPRRLTDNKAGDCLAAVSPHRKRIVFDSNRRRASGESLFTSDLFLKKTYGKEQQFLTRGSSAGWSPDGKYVVFHASASGNEEPFRNDLGSATKDSDIFVINVGDCLEQHDACQVAGSIKRNLTNTNPMTEDEPYAVEDNPD